MSRIPRGRALMAGLLALAAAVSSGVEAQQYPVKPVRMIIPFAPGGNTDIIGRVFAPKFGEIFYSTAGRGTVGHLAAELINSAAGIKVARGAGIQPE